MMVIHLMTVALATALPAQPVTPAPAPRPACAARPPGHPPDDPFMIFFDRDSAAITPNAARVLANVAEAWRVLSLCELLVAAHADRAGSDAHNLALSQRRGRAVVAYLRRLGVDAAAPEIEAFGETRPLVGTPDGVAEAQNRRAEIIVTSPSDWGPLNPPSSA